jgi:hypothetical protein
MSESEVRNTSAASTRNMKDGPWMHSCEATGSDPGQLLDLYVRIVADDTTVSIGENEYVYILKRKILDCKGGTSQPVSSIRIFFYGHELRDDAQLKDCRGIMKSIEAGVCVIGQMATETPM